MDEKNLPIAENIIKIVKKEKKTLLPQPLIFDVYIKKSVLDNIYRVNNFS